MLPYGLSIFAVINCIGKIFAFCMPYQLPSFVSELPVNITLFQSFACIPFSLHFSYFRRKPVW